MNNKQKFVFRKIALSALIVSALGSAAALANAATPTADVKPVKAVTAPGPLSVKLQDPLVVAKQYAPETAAAWEKLLNEYNTLITDNTASLVERPFATPSAASQPEAAPAAPAAVPVADQNLTLVPVQGDFDFSSIEVQAGTATPVEGVKIDASKLSGVTQPAPVAAPAAAADQTPVPVPAPTPAPAPAQGVAVLNAGAVGLEKAAPAEDSLLQRQIDLAQAVASKDANSIKTALSKLFSTYETQIKHMHESK
ncbi:hypothetical protein [Paenibacillus physcomitrellae]|uniref:Uncharacterized protein n=1 Tax=Paenibacillus physcomitrellae TaxID=1619311 RepID=A0ABQ1GH11_9BACL|nr:hypothetical protein [Paenibacillus physcomitrellae]GGA43481.1 hypothetical protein GCM10010917_30970 [Paenibacillus physcomitrellae]